MANPQKENGYIQIATEIYDALCKIRIPGEARQVLDLIIRKTYGFHKKEDAIALSQFTKGTGLKKSSVQRALCKLYELNLVYQKESPIAHIYRFNKDYETWKPYTKKDTGTLKRVRGGLQKVNNRTPKRGIQKIVSIDTLTKDRQLTPAQSNIDYFENQTSQQKTIDYLIGKGASPNMAKEEVRKFIAYWTEPNSTGTKQRWQLEKTFELQRRLNNWFSKVNQFNKTKNNERTRKWG